MIKNILRVPIKIDLISSSSFISSYISPWSTLSVNSNVWLDSSTEYKLYAQMITTQITNYTALKIILIYKTNRKLLISEMTRIILFCLSVWSVCRLLIVIDVLVYLDVAYMWQSFRWQFPFDDVEWDLYSVNAMCRKL